MKIKIAEMINYINLTVKGSARQLSNLLSLASDIASRPENFEDTKGRITVSYTHLKTKVFVGGKVI